MINLISKRHHLAHSWPVTREAPISGENIDPFKSIKRYRLWVEELGPKNQGFVEPFPGVHKIIILLVGLFDKRWVLEPLKVVFVPVHKNISVLGPHPYHLPILGFFFFLDLVQNESMDHHIFSLMNVLAE